MLSYIFRRLIIAFFMLIGIGIVSFLVIKLPPGDFASRYQQYLIDRGSPREEAERAAQIVRQQYGLDKPTTTQFFMWVKEMVTEGKFGYSFAYRKDVGMLIADRLPKTLMLALLCHAISTVVGVGLGIFVAPRKYGFWDNLWAILAFIFTSVPRFSIAIIILYIVVIDLKLPSISSFYSPQYVFAPWSLGKVVDMFKHIWPVLIIAGLGGVARNLRVMRGNLLDVLGSQYVQTARSKGLRESHRHLETRGTECAAYHRRLPGHGTALYDAGRAGGRHRFGPANHGASVLRVSGQPGYLCLRLVTPDVWSNDPDRQFAG